MVNNSTNINKMYNHLALQTIERKNIMAYGVGNRGPGLGQVQKSAGFNFLVHYHLYIPSSQSNKWNVIILTFINEIYKTLLPKVYFVGIIILFKDVWAINLRY